MSNTGQGNPACPYLGLEDDPDTSLAFPSLWNACHRGRRLVSPSLDHQAEHCLSENHRNCIAFRTEQSTLPLPYQLRAVRYRKRASNSYQNLAFIGLGILLIIVLAWKALSRPSAPPPAPSPVSTALMTPPTLSAAAMTRTPTAAMTQTPIPATLTGETISEHRLEQPIGRDYTFVIHKVLDGENMNQYAARYHTSIEAILLVNYNLKMPLLVDAVVIIPVGITDVSKIPVFEAYQVTGTDSLLKVLALRFGVRLQDLKYYNAIGADETIHEGDWLLIPHPRRAS